MPNIVNRPAGREQSCVQCSRVYRAARASARYCSPACRLKAHRGVPDAAAVAKTGKATRDPSTFTIIGKVLVKVGMAGMVARELGGLPVYGLTVPSAQALHEIAGLFDQKGWGTVSEAEFAEALAIDGIQPHAVPSEQTLYRQRTAARQRAA